MNIVEKEATIFFEYFFRSGKVNNLENLKSKLTAKLYDFKRDRDKLDFLKILRNSTSIALEEHKKNCRGGSCRFEEEREIGLFVVDQEIYNLNSYYRYEAEDKDKFSAEQEATLHIKLNEIADQLHKLGLGQEIVFSEIESLKNHFDLGKKTWFQLVMGKLLDLTLEKALDKTIIKGIYLKLSEGFSNIAKQLE